MNLKARFNHMFGFNTSEQQPVFAELTNIGHRANNQDYACHLIDKQGVLLVVADGLGGHQGGELASRLFCEAFKYLASLELYSLRLHPEVTLQALIEAASSKMSKALIEEHEGIDAHTTCAIAWLSLPDKILTTAHIGDSRIYRFDRSQVSWRSHDHSFVQFLVDTCEISEADMGSHPGQGALTRSISVNQPAKPTIEKHKQPLADGEALLLCTDGLWEMINNDEIVKLAVSYNPEKSLRNLVQTAIQRAAPKSDNVTAQIYIP